MPGKRKSNLSRKTRNAKRLQAIVDSESESDRSLRLENLRQNYHIAIANESETEAAQRRENTRLRTQATIVNESETESLQRRENNRLRMQAAIADESETETLHRRENDRYGHQTARENESRQSRNIRLLTPNDNLPGSSRAQRQRPPRINNYKKACNQLIDVIEDNIEEFYCGPLDYRCDSCGSKNFKGEKTPTGFNSCCHRGKVRLPPIKNDRTLQALMTGNHEDSKNFMEHIRSYNSAFAFASMGAQVKPPPGNGPFCFRIHGQTYHTTAPLHPRQGDEPQYAQIYILDPEEANNARIGNPANAGCLPTLIHTLDQIMRNNSPFAQAWKMMRDYEIEEEERAKANGQEPPQVIMSIINDKYHDQRRYNAPRCNEVALIFQNALGEPPFNRDIRIHSRTENRTIRISFLHKKCDAMTYPLLFPYGDSGWKVDLTCQEALSAAYQQANNYEINEPENAGDFGQKITQLQYYSYRLAIRDEFNPLLNAGKLTQQFIVDSYCKIEANRLNWIKMNQKKLRAESYTGLVDYLHHRAENEGLKAGTAVILPSSFQGSPRAMQENFQDAMRIVTKFTKPDLFITMTCNPKWTEITENLEPWQRPEHRPDLVARVFNLKLHELMHDITAKNYFGVVVAHVHVIEFQKRGLPHAHMLIILQSDDKPKEPEMIDKVVCAEIPNPETHPRLHEIVMQNMIHGPCGTLNPNSVCMCDGNCQKGFPKDFQNETNSNIDGYPRYRRRNDGKTFAVGRFQVNNQWVVPYNPFLLLKYKSHINVEICASIKSVKYLFKYIYKGHDCANVKFNTLTWNEPDMYMDSRYISAPEAMWRIREYKMHGKSHAIVRLAVHLENMQQVFFQDGAEDDAIMDHLGKTTLTSWFELNRADEDARELYYMEIPEHYLLNKEKQWQARKNNIKVIGRMYSVSVAQGELYYLRLLLLHVRGAKSFTDLRTVNGTVCDTYKEAAIKLQLLADDSQWESFLIDAIALQMPYQLREAFAVVCVYGEPTNPLGLWEKFKDDFCEDYIRSHGAQVAEQYALRDLQEIFSMHRKTNADFGLPIPTDDLDNLVHMLDLEALAAEADELISKLNPAQRRAFDAIIDAYNNEQSQSRCFFLDGPGGSGKTFLYNTLTKYLQAQGQRVVSVASTGLAANELEGGTTYHSRFGLGVNTNETTTSKIRPTSKAGRELRDASIIIWDEITMTPNYNMNAIDNLLRDITNKDLPFGNKVFIIGGDFRQTLPIVKRGGRTQILQSTIKYSRSWPRFQKFSLHENMRTGNEANDHNEWLLKLGDGNLSNDYDLGESIIEIPSDFVEAGDLVTSIFGSIDLSNKEQLAETAILTPKNEHVHQLNRKVLDLIPGEVKTYSSMDSIVSDEQVDYPVEFLNSLTPTGMPLHNLELKVGAVIMLLRNLNIKRGLCNGTRLIVNGLRNHVIHAEILKGRHKGQQVLIPRIDVMPADGELPFQFKRRQFPITLAFVMTINKSQGQSLDNVGIYLPSPVFSHGQLYVAFSRGRKRENIKIKMLPTSTQGQLVEGSDKWFTVNCVYKEIFQ